MEDLIREDQRIWTTAEEATQIRARIDAMGRIPTASMRAPRCAWTAESLARLTAMVTEKGVEDGAADAIAESLGTSPRRVRQIAREHGLIPKKRERRALADGREELARTMAATETSVAIAAAIRCDVRTLRQWAAANGVVLIEPIRRKSVTNRKSSREPRETRAPAKDPKERCKRPPAVAKPKSETQKPPADRRGIGRKTDPVATRPITANKKETTPKARTMPIAIARKTRMITPLEPRRRIMEPAIRDPKPRREMPEPARRTYVPATPQPEGREMFRIAAKRRRPENPLDGSELLRATQDAIARHLETVGVTMLLVDPTEALEAAVRRAGHVLLRTEDAYMVDGRRIGDARDLKAFAENRSLKTG